MEFVSYDTPKHSLLKGELSIMIANSYFELCKIY